MKRDGNPHLISGKFGTHRLSRLELGDRGIQEADLQVLLDGNPSLLPISRFDETFAPAISLGREIMGIDNVFISPRGRLTVVETKLWRNPQAVREVLAQMIDYASRLSELDYETLESRCRNSGRSPVGEKGLYGLAQAAYPKTVPDEARFIDQVNRDLQNGRFLLLVVGDGIRDGLERMLDALHHQSRLHFTFGLVELRLYRMPDSEDILAVPSVVCHSTEIERAVVTVRQTTTPDVQVEVRSDTGDKAPRLSEREFLESIRDLTTRKFAEKVFDWARDNAAIQIVANSAAIRVPFSTTRKGLILMRLFRTGRVYVTPPKLRKTLSNAGVEQDLVLEIAQQLKSIFPSAELRPDHAAVIPSMRASQLLEKFEEVIAIYDAAAKKARAMDPGVDSASEAEDEDEEAESED